jgi:hypothetical protein
MKLHVDKLRQMFPKASADFIEANAAPDAAPEQPEPKQKHPRAGPKPPTKTEAEFGLMLKIQQDRGEVIDYKFHGITLRYADGLLRYTPDWVVTSPISVTRWRSLKLIEIKGARIPPTFWQHARQRFLACKAEWQDIFEFEMWQRSKEGTWNRIL